VTLRGMPRPLLIARPEAISLIARRLIHRLEPPIRADLNKEDAVDHNPQNVLRRVEPPVDRPPNILSRLFQSTLIEGVEPEVRSRHDYLLAAFFFLTVWRASYRYWATAAGVVPTNSVISEFARLTRLSWTTFSR